MSRSIHFFATKRDLTSLLTAVESVEALRYTRTGLFTSPDTFAVESGLRIPNLGVASSADYISADCYLVTNAQTLVEVREVPQRRGGTLYAVDQEANRRSVTLWPGGVFEESCVIAGQVGSGVDDPVSKEFLNLFAHEVRQQFKRIKSFFVGPEAEQLLDAGYRLTTSVQRPQEYDLSRN